MALTDILIDFHGVLTDGRQSIDHTGQYMFDHVHTRDIRALRELVARGYNVRIITASASPIIKSFAEKVGVSVHCARDKAQLIETFQDIHPDYIAIGDDAWDVQMLAKAALAFCPADADESVKLLPAVNILQTKGGHGVIAEMLRYIAKI
jgi:3-deoxy-D-manno-octulosonate 8-phosphate phosphatase KdsC-like HAD superfamily phosphatase